MPDANSVVEKIEAIIAPHLREGGPGLAVGVRSHGQTLLFKGYGLAHLELDTPIDPALRFAIASVTKPLTALCALTLAEAGALDLDARIGEYLPHLKPALHAPTLRQLMAHQSGLRCHLDLELFSGFDNRRPVGFADITYETLASLNAEPGAWQVYGNAGFYLVSKAIEVVTGEPFQNVLQRQVLAPLGMQDTLLLSPGKLTRRLVSAYSATPDGGWTNVSHMRSDNLGEGGAASTVGDLLKFAEAVRREDPIFPEHIWRQMKTPAVLADGSRSDYGLGLVSQSWRGVEVLGHAGSLFGVATAWLSAPDHALDVVVLANTELGADPLARSIIQTVVDEDGLDPPADPARTGDFPGLAGAVFVAPHMVFGFSDMDGRVGAMLQGVSGLPMNMGADGRSLSAPGATAPLVVDLPDGPDGATAVFRMGGEAHRGVRAGPAPAAAQVAEAAAGDYWSSEIGAGVRISLDTEGLKIDTQGRHGATSGRATPIAEDVLQVSSPLAHYVIRLSRSEGGVDGLLVYTTRTRAFRFERVAPSAPSRGLF